MSLFKKKDPKDQVREWKQNLRREGTGIERQIRGIQREEQKVTKQIKDAAKKGSMDAAKILAKELIQSRKAVNKLYATKAQLNSVSMQMDHQLAIVRMSGAIEKSTEVMKAMGQIVKLPEIRKSMMELAKEMHKAGVLEEMIDDTVSLQDDDDIEDVANSEIDKVLQEVINNAASVPARSQLDTELGAEPDGAEAAVSDDEDVETMAARLQALRN